LTTLSCHGGLSEIALNRLQLDKQVSYIRNSVKATVALRRHGDAVCAGRADPVLKAWESVFPGTVKPKSDISPVSLRTCAIRRTCFKVQRSLLAK